MAAQNRKWSRTSALYLLTPLHVWSRGLRSLTAASVRYCTTNFTGSTFPTACSQAYSARVHRITGVWTAAHCTIPVGLPLRPSRRCWHSPASTFTTFPVQQLSLNSTGSFFPQHPRGHAQQARYPRNLLRECYEYVVRSGRVGRLPHSACHALTWLVGQRSAAMYCCPFVRVLCCSPNSTCPTCTTCRYHPNRILVDTSDTPDILVTC